MNNLLKNLLFFFLSIFFYIPYIFFLDKAGGDSALIYLTLLLLFNLIIGYFSVFSLKLGLENFRESKSWRSFRKYFGIVSFLFGIFSILLLTLILIYFIILFLAFAP